MAEMRGPVSGPAFSGRRLYRPLLLLAGLLGAGSGSALAMQAGPDFLLGPPAGAAAFRAGYNLADARGSIFDHFVEHLTLDRGDFHSAAVAVETAFWLHPSVDLTTSLGYVRRGRSSSMRGFVDTDGLPIRQRTVLTQLPLLAGFRVFPMGRGRAIGRNAWMPARLAPFLDGGGGFVRYHLSQTGEFVDYTDLMIFQDSLTSSGWGGATQLGAGVEFNLGPWVFLSADVRRNWAHAEMAGRFVGFDPIDLGGWQFGFGLHRRF